MFKSHQDKGKDKSKDWLELLQQESWQLELIVSGFAIFLVASAYEPLQNLNHKLSVISGGLEGNDIYINLPRVILMGIWLFLLTNLIFHVLFRGLWISTIGLRYVSGDVDFDTLKFAPKFDTYLKKKVGSFDTYIERLERLCSIIFSFTFLIIFCLISFGFFTIFFAFFFDTIIGNTIMPLIDNEMIREGIMMVLGIVFLITSLLYLIDFLSLGWIKRQKWLSRFYYPIYRFYSVITFSNFYRPIYYNLIDNKFGRKIGFLIVPYIFTAIFLMSVYSTTHAYFPEEDLQENRIENFYYLDNLEKDKVIRRPIIPSKFINDNYLEIFIPYYSMRDNKALKLICPDFKPLKETGIGQHMVNMNFNEKEEISDEEKLAKRDSSFQCLQQLIDIRFKDSINLEMDFLLHKHPNNEEPGLLVIVDVAPLKRGKHILYIKKQRSFRKDSLQLKWGDPYVIPFWKTTNPRIPIPTKIETSPALPEN